MYTKNIIRDFMEWKENVFVWYSSSYYSNAVYTDLLCEWGSL